MGKRTTSLFQALKKQNIAELITKDKTLTKHKVSFKFNAANSLDGEGRAEGDGNWGLGT